MGVFKRKKWVRGARDILRNAHTTFLIKPRNPHEYSPSISLQTLQQINIIPAEL